MHFSVLFAVLTGITTIAAFQIPAKQANGVYSVTEDADGNEIHTFIKGITRDEFAIRGKSFSKQEKEKRQVQIEHTVVCRGFEGSLVSNDNGVAATNVANQCGDSALVGPRLNYYAIINCSVAYFCNLKYVSQVCTHTNAWNAFNQINDVCGRDTPGYLIYTDTNGQDQYGYEDFCGQPGAHFCR